MQEEDSMIPISSLEAVMDIKEDVRHYYHHPLDHQSLTSCLHLPVQYKLRLFSSISHMMISSQFLLLPVILR